MTTLELGRNRTWRLPRFSALDSVFRASPSTEMRTMVWVWVWGGRVRAYDGAGRRREKKSERGAGVVLFFFRRSPPPSLTLSLARSVRTHACPRRTHARPHARAPAYLCTPIPPLQLGAPASARSA